MKHTIYRLLAGMTLAWLCTTPITSVQAASTARFVNLETPFRCAVKHFGDLDIATTLALGPNDFQLTFFDKMDDLPRYEVNGLSFTKRPIDEALQHLVDEAGITVYTEDGYYPAMNADAVYGELGEVVADLAAAGDIFYRYDAARRELYLSRQGRFELQLPANRMVMLAMLDALRGAGIKNVRPDWKMNTILMSLTRPEKATVEQLIASVVQDGYLLLADAQVYAATPKASDSNWQRIVRKYGAGRVYSANNGLIGKVLAIGNQRPVQEFMAALESEFTLAPVSQGVAIVPNGWKMRFNIGQCSVRDDMASLSVLLHTWIRSPEKVETDITLDSQSGEMGSFNTVSAIDDELIIIGVPMNKNSSDELFATLKLRLIRLVKEK